MGRTKRVLHSARISAIRVFVPCAALSLTFVPKSLGQAAKPPLRIAVDSVPRTWSMAQDPNDNWTEYTCTANEEPDFWKSLDPKTREEYEKIGR